jgi:hypothetical protein
MTKDAVVVVRVKGRLVRRSELESAAAVALTGGAPGPQTVRQPDGGLLSPSGRVISEQELEAVIQQSGLSLQAELMGTQPPGPDAPDYPIAAVRWWCQHYRQMRHARRSEVARQSQAITRGWGLAGLAMALAEEEYALISIYQSYPADSSEREELTCQLAGFALAAISKRHLRVWGKLKRDAPYTTQPSTSRRRRGPASIRPGVRIQTEAEFITELLPAVVIAANGYAPADPTEVRQAWAEPRPSTIKRDSGLAGMATRSPLLRRVVLELEGRSPKPMSSPLDESSFRAVELLRGELARAGKAARLSPREREAFEVYQRLGLGPRGWRHQRAAEALGVDRGTAHKLFVRGLNKLGRA